VERDAAPVLAAIDSGTDIADGPAARCEGREPEEQGNERCLAVVSHLLSSFSARAARAFLG
jgi:hypothetical protein